MPSKAQVANGLSVEGRFSVRAYHAEKETAGPNKDAKMRGLNAKCAPSNPKEGSLPSLALTIKLRPESTS